MVQYAIKNLNFKYNQTEKMTLNNVNFEIEKGDFVIIEGRNGSGKSTLLRLLKKNLNTYGEYDGEVLFDGKNILEIEDRVSAHNIGYICQNIEEQIVTDKVYHELAFGLENIGYDNDFIKRRVAEVSSFFNIEHLFMRDIKTLSGGQKQIVNIASIMVFDPKVILLDEPTSQLDPIGREEFIDFLSKINKTYGTTIIIIEHNVEKISEFANKILIMDKGTVLYYGEKNQVIEKMAKDDLYKKFLPSITKIFIKNSIDYYPLDICDAKRYLIKSNISISQIKNLKCENNLSVNNKMQENENSNCKNVILKCNNLSFRYDKKSLDVLNDVSFNLFENEVLCIFGGNGSGKTTLMKNLAKVLRYYNGKVEILKNNYIDIQKIKNENFYAEDMLYLPQDIKSIFVKNTIREELIESFGKDYLEKIKDFKYDFTSILDRHPYDLSGGEMQFLAILKLVNKNQKIIVFDEPTKALDVELKENFVEIVKEYKNRGKTIIIVTHDIEIADEVADRCMMLFNNEIASVNDKENFFKNNIYYTNEYFKLCH